MARWLIALLVAGFSLVTYCTGTSDNPITGEKQRVALSAEEELALGQRAAPEMAARMGGVSRDAAARERVRRLGERLVRGSIAARSPYRFTFEVLADARTVNAFALPGGPIFVTEGLLSRLRSDGELAAVLAHEIGHVIARHSSEQLAKAQLTQGLIGAAVLGSGDWSAAQIGQVVGTFLQMRYGRADELESDALGLRIMAEAGYDPRAMIAVMDRLAQSSGGSARPEFLSTHPHPENRQARIREEIARLFPSGMPSGLAR